MSKSPGKTQTRKTRRKTVRAHIFQAKPVLTYKVGVYFPERDVMDFVIKANDFELKNGVAHFYLINGKGSKEFIARFTYVAYVFVQEPTEIQLRTQVVLPENWGKVI